MASVTVTGLKELADALRALPAEVASKNGGPLARALREAGKVIQQDAIARAPIGEQDPAPGRLRRSIIVKRDPNPGDVNERMFVTVRRGKSYKDLKGAKYWRFVEFGSEKQQPQPFLRPAFEAKKVIALATFIAKLKDGIARATRKAAKLGLRGRG